MARALAAACAALATLTLACGRDAGPAWPPGAHLSANGPAFRDLLARFSGLEGTPLGRHARRLAERTEGCREVAGRADDGSLDALLESVACADAPPGAGIALARGDADLLWIAPLGEARRLVARGRATRAGWVLDAQLDPPARDGPAALLAPSAEPAGRAVLAAQSALVHARVRPRGGLDLASLVPAGSQGDRLFRLRSALFSGAVLGGTWEVAAYMPGDADALPPMAVALDVRSRDAAVRAAETFLSEIAAAWPVHRTPARFRASEPVEGACLLDLNILPGFAPCYAATERALVVGWNPASLERALAGPAPAPAEAASHLAVRLDRLDEADRRLRASRGLDARDAERSWGFRRLEVSPAPDETAEWRIELVAAEPER
jgi:hypothetical protein